MQAVLEHLESVIVMPSAQDFVELVNTGGQSVDEVPWIIINVVQLVYRSEWK